MTASSSSPSPSSPPHTVGLDPDLQQKYDRLRQLFADMDCVLVAYSGGIDSTLIAKVAWDTLDDRLLAITAVSPSLMPEDLDEAIEQAAEIGFRHEMVNTHEMENPDYANNPINRCYFCKSELHDTLKPLGLERGYPYVVDGVNADDLQDYRPGVQAAKERGARSPLAEVGMTKFEVRQLSRHLGLPWWNKPAQPCLSSRFPYGEAITVEKLARVAAGERYLRQLGWRQVRVRSEQDTARIELPPEAIAEFVSTADLPVLVHTFKQAGFTYVSLDLEGYRSGKLNQTIAPKDREKYSPGIL
ncbi:MAG: ATP-dependent sacrificial sulfur transferase LarE [Cyanobacteria bacterium P01_A01_bin.3]